MWRKASAGISDALVHITKPVKAWAIFFSSKRFKSDSSLWSFLFLARIIKMICCALLDYGNNHVRGKGEERLALERRIGVSGADGGITAPEEPLLRLYQS